MAKCKSIEALAMGLKDVIPVVSFQCSACGSDVIQFVDKDRGTVACSWYCASRNAPFFSKEDPGRVVIFRSGDDTYALVGRRSRRAGRGARGNRRKSARQLKKEAEEKLEQGKAKAGEQKQKAKSAAERKLKEARQKGETARRKAKEKTKTLPETPGMPGLPQPGTVPQRPAGNTPAPEAITPPNQIPIPMETPEDDDLTEGNDKVQEENDELVETAYCFYKKIKSQINV